MAKLSITTDVPFTKDTTFNVWWNALTFIGGVVVGAASNEKMTNVGLQRLNSTETAKSIRAKGKEQFKKTKVIGSV